MPAGARIPRRGDGERNPRRGDNEPVPRVPRGGESERVPRRSNSTRTKATEKADSFGQRCLATATDLLWRLLILLWQPFALLLGRLRRYPAWRIGRWSLVVILPVLGINLSVGFFGHSLVFPLSPFFLREKAAALGLYLLHRPRCLLEGHPDPAPLIVQAERRHKLPRGLLAAIIEVESRGRPHRISSAGAMGPGQLMRHTSRGLGVSDPFDTAENIDAAARYLAAQWRTFHDVRLVAAAYNAGPGSIVHRRVPHNGQTEYYVTRVLHAMERARPAQPAAHKAANSRAK